MGNILKLIGFGLAIVGIGLSLAMPWWHSDMLGAGTFEITLRKAEMCGGGSCTSVPVGGMYGIVGMMTTVYGAIAVLMIGLGGFVPALSGEPTRPMAIIGGLVYIVLCALSYGSLGIPDELMMMANLNTTIYFKAGIVGAALAVFAPMLGWLEPKRKAEPYRQVEVPRADRPGRISSLPPMGAPQGPPTFQDRARTPSRAPLAPIAIDLDDPTDTPGAITRSDTPMPMGLAEAARPRSSRSGLRFAITSAEIREDALSAIGEDGQRREIRWSDLGGALARELPAPHDTLLVDLVPVGAPPLRFVLASRLTFSSGGKDGGDPRDGLRRLLAFARAMHPEIELEAATTDFLYKRTDLPAWTAEDLDRYDARYG